MIIMGNGFDISKADWVSQIADFEAAGYMDYVSLPKRPVELTGWDTEMVREACRSSNSQDRKYGKMWHEWIRRVEMTESENRDRLRQLLAATQSATALGRGDLAERFRGTLSRSWGVTDEGFTAYCESYNRVAWIAQISKKEDGPTAAERDPLGGRYA